MMTEPRPEHRSVDLSDLTTRQREVARLVERYYDVAQELPSTGWISRRLRISRERARKICDDLKRKGWRAST